ncbi:MAG: hypothetical protein IPK19_20320 [Chloroflexi bacterium]|nr:hypothetical protein [Chloroflexota bacterium]
MMRQQHPLFQQYPLDGQVTIGGETLSTPYHIYDGSILFIGGTANARAASDLLAGEQLMPLLDSDGKALMAVWVCDFTEANLGQHHELQISIFASFSPVPPVTAHPFAIYRALILNPAAMMICHGLWNNTERVVRYNREHLLLDARLSRRQIDRTAASWRFQVEDAERGQRVAEGELTVPGRQPPQALMAMAGHLGLRGMMQSMRAPFIHVPVVNTRAAGSAANRIAHTYTKADKQVIRTFGPGDRLTIHDPRYAALRFEPAFVQHNDGVRFVYLRPE